MQFEGKRLVKKYSINTFKPNFKLLINFLKEISKIFKRINNFGSINFFKTGKIIAKIIKTGFNIRASQHGLKQRRSTEILTIKDQL